MAEQDKKVKDFALADFKLNPISSAENVKKALVIDENDDDILSLNASQVTAQISTASLGPGQMLRWRVIATDNTAIAATDPPYIDPLDNDQYFGTVAADASIETALPVLWWFTRA